MRSTARDKDKDKRPIYAQPDWAAKTRALARQTRETVETILRRLGDPDYHRAHAVEDLQQLSEYLRLYAEGTL